MSVNRLHTDVGHTHNQRLTVAETNVMITDTRLDNTLLYVTQTLAEPRLVWT